MKTKLLFLGLLLVSCNSDEKPSVQDDLILSPSYIVMYTTGELKIDDRVDFWSIEHTNKATGYCVSFLNPDGVTSDEFVRLSERNGDTSFNNYLSDYDRRSNICFADNFRSIHFVSDADWDATHPAGSSLDDIVTVMLSSYAPFVQSGYDRNAPGLSQWGAYTFYQRHASELTEKEMAMIGWQGIGFYFDTAPDDPTQVHTITVTLQTVDGETLTVTGRGTPPWGDYEPIG